MIVMVLLVRQTCAPFATREYLAHAAQKLGELRCASAPGASVGILSRQMMSLSACLAGMKYTLSASIDGVPAMAMMPKQMLVHSGATKNISTRTHLMELRLWGGVDDHVRPILF